MSSFDLVVDDDWLGATLNKRRGAVKKKRKKSSYESTKDLQPSMEVDVSLDGVSSQTKDNTKDVSIVKSLWNQYKRLESKEMGGSRWATATGLERVAEGAERSSIPLVSQAGAASKSVLTKYRESIEQDMYPGLVQELHTKLKDYPLLAPSGISGQQYYALPQSELTVAQDILRMEPDRKRPRLQYDQTRNAIVPYRGSAIVPYGGDPRMVPIPEVD